MGTSPPESRRVTRNASSGEEAIPAGYGDSRATSPAKRAPAASVARYRRGDPRAL